MIAELILEAERKGNAAEICRREGIAPNLFYRWRTRFKEAVCRVLELNPRAVYRWKSGQYEKSRHGGGGGLNKITPLEEKRVLTLARKLPQWRCRRIAYELERKSLVFIRKTRVAEILKVHGLNHEFVRGAKRDQPEPADMLSHEPWRKN
jgi:transposase-like protein